MAKLVWTTATIIPAILVLVPVRAECEGVDGTGTCPTKMPKEDEVSALLQSKVNVEPMEQKEKAQRSHPTGSPHTKSEAIKKFEKGTDAVVEELTNGSGVLPLNLTKMAEHEVEDLITKPGFISKMEKARSAFLTKCANKSNGNITWVHECAMKTKEFQEYVSDKDDPSFLAMKKIGLGLVQKQMEERGLKMNLTAPENMNPSMIEQKDEEEEDLDSNQAEGMEAEEFAEEVESGPGHGTWTGPTGHGTWTGPGHGTWTHRIQVGKILGRKLKRDWEKGNEKLKKALERKIKGRSTCVGVSRTVCGEGALLLGLNGCIGKGHVFAYSHDSGMIAEIWPFWSASVGMSTGFGYSGDGMLEFSWTQDCNDFHGWATAWDGVGEGVGQAAMIALNGLKFVWDGLQALDDFKAGVGPAFSAGFVRADSWGQCPLKFPFLEPGEKIIGGAVAIGAGKGAGATMPLPLSGACSYASCPYCG